MLVRSEAGRQPEGCVPGADGHSCAPDRVTVRMPAKAACRTAPSPFKGESFPQYVLYRSTRGSTRQCIAGDKITGQTLAAIPVAVDPTPPAQLTAASNSDQDPQVPRRARLTGAGVAKRSLPSPSLRPSLSEQLKAISHGAQAITAQLAATYNLPGRALATSSSHAPPDQLPHDKLAFQATTIGLGVGKLECRFPYPATFASDRCTYLFQHPFEAKEVLMVMYYRDMLHASVSMADRSFRFRLSRVLEHFGDDYNPANAQHWIRVVLATSSEAQKVRQFLAGLGVVDRSRSSRRTMSCNSQKQNGP